ANYFRRLSALVECGQGCTEAIVIGERPDSAISVGSRYLFDQDGRPTTQLADGSPATEVGRHLVPLARRPEPSVHHGIAYLPILPRVTLLVVGGGHVGQAVANLAAEVDFEVCVLDDRERYASRERFPMAQRRFVGDIGTLLKQLAAEITPSFFCIIV